VKVLYIPSDEMREPRTSFRLSGTMVSVALTSIVSRKLTCTLEAHFTVVRLPSTALPFSFTLEVSLKRGLDEGWDMVLSAAINPLYHAGTALSFKVPARHAQRPCIIIFRWFVVLFGQPTPKRVENIYIACESCRDPRDDLYLDVGVGYRCSSTITPFACSFFEL
jgi:hypothetical protein